MNWAAAASTGFGLGLACFGSLWMSMRNLRAANNRRFAAGRLARLGLATVTFYALLKSGGTTAAIAGLGGMLSARWYLFRTVGSDGDGR